MWTVDLCLTWLPLCPFPPAAVRLPHPPQEVEQLCELLDFGGPAMVTCSKVRGVGVEEGL